MSRAISVKRYIPFHSRGWSLVKQVLVSISLVIILLAIGANLVIRNIETSYLNQLLEAESERTTNLVAQAALEGIISEDIPHLQTIVEQVGATSPSILSISIFSYDHKELANWSREQSLHLKQFVVWRKSVVLEGEEFGYIVIHWRTDLISQQVDKHVNYLSYLVLGVVIVVGLVSFLLIHWLVIKPIQRINHDLSHFQQNDSVILNNRPMSKYSAIELLNLSQSVNDLSQLWNHNRQRERRLLHEVELRKEAEQELVYSRDNLQREVAKKTQELRQAMKNAKKANHSKSTFLANMSHELRTPMHAILSFSRFGLLKYDSVNQDKLKSYFANIHESANRLLLLLNDLLDLAKLEAGKMELNIMSNDICMVSKNCIVEMEAAMEEKSLSIEWHCSSKELLGKFDRLRVAQVIVNFLSNAIKFTPEGKKIYLKLESVDNNIQLAVHDEGIGVPCGEYDTVFERFVQSSNSEAKIKGTGLGLSICKEIIEKHQGKIWAEASEKGGAAFKFQLPRAS